MIKTRDKDKNEKIERQSHCWFVIKEEVDFSWSLRKIVEKIVEAMGEEWTKQRSAAPGEALRGGKIKERKIKLEKLKERPTGEENKEKGKKQ